MRGYFVIRRNVFTDQVFADQKFSEREAWLWMVAEAAYGERQVKTKKGLIRLSRGQLTSSTRFMAKKCKWSESRVRRYIKQLQECQMIAVNNDAIQNVITICNYDAMQDMRLGDDAKTTHSRRDRNAQTAQTRTQQTIDTKTQPKTGIPLKSGATQLPQAAIEAGRLAAPGYDIYELEREYLQWVNENEINVKNVVTHFRDFCSKRAKGNPIDGY